MAFLVTWLVETWAVLMEAAPWLLGGFLLAGVLHELLPAGQIARQLGGQGWRAVVKAAVIGIPLPLCSCSVIPLASTLRKNGASRGATASFLISAPETGVDSIALSYALLGPVMAVIRPVAALVTALVAGGLINRLVPAVDAPSEDAVPGADCCGNTSCKSVEDLSVTLPRTSRLRSMLRYAAIDMFVDLAPWLALGFASAGLISALMPPGFIERQVGHGVVPMLLMLVIGLPLYVCATSSTPIAAALIATGLSPGAALVFLLVGPATNTATMLVVGRELGRRSLVIYLASIAVVALAAGTMTDIFLAGALATRVGVHPHETPAAWLEWACGLALLVLIANGLRLRLEARLRKVSRAPRIP